MQIEIYNPAQGQPLPAIQWNYAEVKKWVEDGLEAYKGRVYTEDNITDAKKDRAALNKLADAIDSKRKEMKALYLKPYEEFEGQAKELTALVKAQSAEIDAQIKAYDDYRRQEKQTAIMEIYNATIGDLAELVPYERLHNPKWLNVTTSMSGIETELTGAIDNIRKSIDAIGGLGLDAELEGRIKSVYLEKLDFAAAMVEKARIEAERDRLKRYEEAKREREAEFARRQAETQAQPETPVREQAAPAKEPEELFTIAFRVEATRSQLMELKAFMKSHGIKYGKA